MRPGVAAPSPFQTIASGILHLRRPQPCGPARRAASSAPMQTIVIGHRNPDMDSICSALAYAELKRLSGHDNVTAARAGATNERIDFVLEKFGVEAPPLISDLSPRVSDVMQPKVISVRGGRPSTRRCNSSTKSALRGLPVVDDDNRCLGLLSAFKVSHHLFPPREEASTARLVTASLADIVTTFGGALVTGSLSRGSPRSNCSWSAPWPRLLRAAHRQLSANAKSSSSSATARASSELAIEAASRPSSITGGFRSTRRRALPPARRMSPSISLAVRHRDQRAARARRGARRVA